MGLAGNILVTQLAWKAGHTAMGYLPESVQNFFGKKQDKGLVHDYLIEHKGVNQSLTETKAVGGVKYTGLNKSMGNVTEESYTTESGYTLTYEDTDESKDVGLMILEGDRKKYYLNGRKAYTSMVIQVQGFDQYLILPCVQGYPIITMNVEQNLMPIASLQNGVTTNRRVVPKEYLFKFPVAYLRIYGTNSENEKKSNTMSALEKFRMRAKQAVNAVNKLKNFENPVGAFTNPSEGQARDIPTYQEIYEEICNFHTQFGVYLYMGFNVPKISCTASITMNSQEGDTDAVFLTVKLVESQEFDYQQFTNTNTSFSNKGAYESNGKTTSDASKSVS